MATRLKNMHLTSVDLVRAGANQEADICLYKSAQEPPEQPTESETNILKQFIAWLRKSGPEGENEPREEEHGHDEDFMTFDQIEDNQQANETLDFYLDALEDSYISIQHDADLDDDAKSEMMLQSLDEFNEAMTELIPALAVTAPWKPHHTEKSADEEAEVDESARFEEIEEVN